MTAADLIAILIRSGDLIPVEVFGATDCCEHGVDADCESAGLGICDLFSEHAPGGSDCNRAANFMVRPSDEAMDDPKLKAAVVAVLREDPPVPWVREAPPSEVIYTATVRPLAKGDLRLSEERLVPLMVAAVAGRYPCIDEDEVDGPLERIAEDQTEALGALAKVLKHWGTECEGCIEATTGAHDVTVGSTRCDVCGKTGLSLFVLE